MQNLSAVCPPTLSNKGVLPFGQADGLQHGDRDDPQLTSPGQCLLYLHITTLHNCWWFHPSRGIFKSQQVHRRPVCKTAPLWVFPHWSEGIFSITPVFTPTLLNGALFPGDFLIETSLAIYNMLYSS